VNGQKSKKESCQLIFDTVCFEMSHMYVQHRFWIKGTRDNKGRARKTNIHTQTYI